MRMSEIAAVERIPNTNHISESSKNLIKNGESPFVKGYKVRVNVRALGNLNQDPSTYARKKPPTTIRGHPAPLCCVICVERRLAFILSS